MKRKPRHYWWLKKNKDGDYVDRAGNIIPRETVKDWDTEENRRLNRMDRKRIRQMIRSGQDV